MDGVCCFAAAVGALRRPPCAARSAGRTRQLGPGYRALRHVEDQSRSTAPTPLRCAARRRRGAAPAAHPHLCVKRRRDSRQRVESQQACSWCSSSSRSVLPARPRAGERRSASAASRSAGARGLRIATRRCVERSLFEHRAQAARASEMPAVRGRSAALAPGHRAPEGSRRAAPTAAAKRSRSPAHGLALSAARKSRQVGCCSEVRRVACPRRHAVGRHREASLIASASGASPRYACCTIGEAITSSGSPSATSGGRCAAR